MQDGGIPDEVDVAAMNRWLFNTDTVDRVIEPLMTNGRRVAGGDVIGKTIVFAKNQRHADFIEERFDVNDAELAGSMARVITHASGSAGRGQSRSVDWGSSCDPSSGSGILPSRRRSATSFRPRTGRLRTR